MNIDLSNPPYAVKLNDLGFAYSYTDREKGIIVYTHADPRMVGSPWRDRWDDMECILDFEDENCMKPLSFTFKNLRNGVSKTIQASNLNLVKEVIRWPPLSASPTKARPSPTTRITCETKSNQSNSTACSENDWTPERNYTFSPSTRRIELKVNINCSPILLLLFGVLALLKIMGVFPYSWIWVIAPIWIPLLALAGITIILIIAWIIGSIGVLILEKFGD